jgi:hypothetical protein
VSQRGNESDWFFGASAALPRAIEWHTWFNYWQERYDLSQPVERLIVDAAMKVHQTIIKLSQAVRKNPGWARNFSEDEMRHILDVAGEAQAWFKNNRPRDDEIERFDPRLKFIVQALGGAFNVMVALAQELDQANRKGFVLVDTGAEAREILGS